MQKQRREKRVTRIYGSAQTPYVRLLAAEEVSAQKKKELQAVHAGLNPFQLTREIERQKKQINAARLLQA